VNSREDTRARPIGEHSVEIKRYYTTRINVEEDCFGIGIEKVWLVYEDLLPSFSTPFAKIPNTY
jgi:hypothetical protein